MTKKHYTKKQGKQVTAFVDGMIYLLGLPSYQVVLSTEPAAKGDLASIQWGNQRYEATVWLGATWADQSDDDKRNTVTHEVLHLMHARVNTSVDRAKGSMHTHEYDPWRRTVSVELELMTDMMANCLSQRAEVIDLWEDAA